MTADRLAVVFAGGGSGGHIFPGLAVAEQLALRDPPAKICFLRSDRAIDRQILETAAVTHTPSPAAPLSLRPSGLVRFARAWPRAVAHARSLLSELGADGQRVVLVSVGGFVAAPAVQAARHANVPVVMLNLDAVPGKANRWIARHAARVLTTVPLDNAAWQPIPPIVRREALAPHDPRECRRLLGLDPGRPTLFVTGASQGAGTINEFMQAFVDRHADAVVHLGWQVLHQAGGSARIDELQAAYDRAGVPAKVVAFVDQMGLAWGAATASIARAAAGTVGEVVVNRVPTLFLPYPFHRDNHQRKNAEPLVRNGAACLATDRAYPQSTLAEAGPLVLGLLQGEPTRRAIIDRLSAIAPGNPLAGALAVVDAIQDAAHANH